MSTTHALAPTRRKSQPCEIFQCRARHYAKGYCKKHYTQVLRHGRLTPERERGIERPCKAPGCASTDTIRFYCRKHARQLRVHGRLTPDREHCMEHEGCGVVGCQNPHRARGLCAKHYNQRRWEQLKARRGSETRRKSARRTQKVA